MSIHAFFYEAFAEEEAALRAALPPGVQAGFSPQTAQASGHVRAPAPLLSIRTQSVIPPAWAPQIRGLLARTTGFDHLLAWRNALPPVPAPALACLPEYCSRAVAEQAALLWMALLRRLPAQLEHWARFDRDGLTGGECAGRTLLIAGVGRIGHEIARIGMGLGMTVLGHDVVKRHPDITYVTWPEGLARAHVLVSAMNLTADNRHFFRRETLAGARPGCLLINVARGELVRTSDLPHLLDAGILGGVALDVFDQEPHVAEALRLGTGTPPGLEVLRLLARHPRVLLTPHNAFNTQEAVARKSTLTAEQVEAFLRDGRFRWPLEIPEH